MNRQKHSATPGEEEEPPEDGEYEPGTPFDGPPRDETDFEDDGHGAPEDAAEGDEDDIETDVVEGESRVAKRGTLKREANSLNHKLTHRYKNPILRLMHSCKDEALQDSSWCIQKGTQEVWRPHYL